jgi:hypothetical protein
MGTAEQRQFDHYRFIYELPTPRRVRVGLLHRVLIRAPPVASVFLIYAGPQELQASRQMAHIGHFSTPFTLNS